MKGSRILENVGNKLYDIPHYQSGEHDSPPQTVDAHGPFTPFEA